jgi:hypothetical protein
LSSWIAIRKETDQSFNVVIRALHIAAELFNEKKRDINMIEFEDETMSLFSLFSCIWENDEISLIIFKHHFDWISKLIERNSTQNSNQNSKLNLSQNLNNSNDSLNTLLKTSEITQLCILIRASIIMKTIDLIKSNSINFNSEIFRRKKRKVENIDEIRRTNSKKIDSNKISNLVLIIDEALHNALRNLQDDEKIVKIDVEKSKIRRIIE